MATNEPDNLELPLDQNNPDPNNPAPDPALSADPALEPSPQPDPTPKPDWREKQIDRQHRKIKELETQAARSAELEAENQRLKELAEAAARRADPADPSPQPAPRPVAQQPAPIKPAVDQEAEWRFRKDIEDLGVKLTTDYGDDWKVAQANFQKMGEIDPNFMQEVLRTDDPAYVLVQLGKDPDKYQQVLDLPVNRRITALVKLGLEKNAQPKQNAPKPSGAPAPIEPIRSGPSAQPPGKVDIYDPKMAGEDNDAAWYAERMRQKRESQGRVWSIGGKAGGR